MRIVRTVAACATLLLLMVGPVLVGVLFGAGLPFVLSLALWFVVFIVVPAVADHRGGIQRRRGYGPYEDLSDLPWQGGTGAS